MKHNNIMKFLADPSKLAAKFDWKRKAGSILALDVGKDKIGLAVASHPESGESALALDPMPLMLVTRTGNRKVLDESVIQELQDVVETFNVCGFVVSWPLQKEGRCGAPCGKVLHTLDCLVEESSSIVNQNRPFCLWDDHHYLPGEDRASEEQYVHKCSSSIAVDVWNDYCSKHWPQLCDDEEQLDEIWDIPRNTYS
ncbi:expressed unknown protein [Seminavis robusta]|uniref:YqgF/RNase H-like domain-containing protein n=1 Tax=Seminavis robusta TaxID=568900 RepID=A0A9N8E514_9STRA|nr:expressed unknown protein [Seminavis robusta]|eukprot:Sro556_g165950.1 n/a (197) ;mRNA; f:31574-32302